MRECSPPKHVMCHVSRVKCHVSRVTCFFFLTKWRVCYQRGLPFLVFSPIWFYEFFHKSSLRVSYNLGFVTILFWRWHIFNFWVLSEFEFFRFHNLSFSSVTIWISEFCHDLSFLLVHLRILSFVKTWIVEFCHSLNYCV